MKLSTLARNLNRIEAYLNKQEAVLSAQIPEWFKKMTKEEQKAYLKEHPGSKLKPGGYKTNKKSVNSRKSQILRERRNALRNLRKKALEAFNEANNAKLQNVIEWNYLADAERIKRKYDKMIKEV